MPASIDCKFIADIYTDFPEKFGVPRQSGLAQSLTGKIVFRPEFRNPDAVRGLEDFSHIWLIWEFSECACKEWSPTVRPPRLGGNKRMGVFATRSPFRPNPIGLSAVKLEKIVHEKENGTVLYVKGADIMSGTPIIDIKPYLPFADSISSAKGGFAESVFDNDAVVVYDDEVLNILPEEKRCGLLDVLKGRPEPSYHNDQNRIYAMSYAGFRVKFSADSERIKLLDIEKEV